MVTSVNTFETALIDFYVTFTINIRCCKSLIPNAIVFDEANFDYNHELEIKYSSKILSNDDLFHLFIFTYYFK